MEVLRGHQEGLEVVIVNPGVIFGYGFPKKGSDVIIQSVKKGLSFYTKGNIGIVSVADVTNCMTQLMKSSINGERYTLVGENISTKALLDFIAEELKLKKPSIEATKLMTSIAWRIDWLISKILNRKRKLSRNTAISSHSVTTFDTSKIEKELNFTFQKKETYLKTILQNYYTRQH
jgi:nucleoside-diphosphate-sugar epimerase